MDFYPVFVNHIAESVHPGELRAIFERHGVVIDVLILAEYGFVNMAREEEAHDVIVNVNGRLLHGLRLHVDYSEEMKLFLSSHRRTSATRILLTMMHAFLVCEVSFNNLNV